MEYRKAFAMLTVVGVSGWSSFGLLGSSQAIGVQQGKESIADTTQDRDSQQDKDSKPERDAADQRDKETADPQKKESVKGQDKRSATKTQQDRKTETVTKQDKVSVSGEATAWRDGNHFLATCLTIENQEEVVIARWAQEKLQHDEAKDFAQMLIKDHSEMISKLKQHAPEAATENFLASTTTTRSRSGSQGRVSEQADRQKDEKPQADQESRTRVDREPSDKTRPSQAQVSQTRVISSTDNLNLDLMQLHREIAEQCLADTKEMLSKKSEEEFDKCFVGLQIAKHGAMKSKLEVFQRYSSGELQDLIAQAISTTTDHLQHAEKLMEKLSDASAQTADANK